MRQGKDDRIWRSAKYSAAAILCAKDGMVISRKSFSLIEESETEALHEIFYSDIEKIFADDTEILLGDGIKIKDARLVITKKDGEILRLPMLHVVAVDHLCEDIMRILASPQA